MMNASICTHYVWKTHHLRQTRQKSVNKKPSRPLRSRKNTQMNHQILFDANCVILILCKRLTEFLLIFCTLSKSQKLIKCQTGFKVKNFNSSVLVVASWDCLNPGNWCCLTSISPIHICTRKPLILNYYLARG